MAVSTTCLLYTSGKEIDEVVVPANYNCPGQIVISGSNKGIETACQKLTEEMCIRDSYKSSIISIDIPPTVKRIGAHAFDNSKITSLIIPNSIEHIENNAFASTYNLRGNIIIPNTTTFIGECAFQHSNFDGTLTLGSGIKEIGPSAFQACHNVKGDLIIPANIQRIGKNAFSYCGSLYKKTLQINAELDTIPTGAFANANLTG